MDITFSIETDEGISISIGTSLTDAEREVLMASLLPVVALTIEEARLDMTGGDDENDDDDGNGEISSDPFRSGVVRCWGGRSTV